MAQTGSVFEQFLANVTAFVNLCCIVRADFTTQWKTIAARVVLESTIKN